MKIDDTIEKFINQLGDNHTLNLKIENAINDNNWAELISLFVAYKSLCDQYVVKDILVRCSNEIFLSDSDNFMLLLERYDFSEQQLRIMYLNIKDSPISFALVSSRRFWKELISHQKQLSELFFQDYEEEISAANAWEYVFNREYVRDDLIIKHLDKVDTTIAENILKKHKLNTKLEKTDLEVDVISALYKKFRGEFTQGMWDAIAEFQWTHIDYIKYKKNKFKYELLKKNKCLDSNYQTEIDRIYGRKREISVVGTTYNEYKIYVNEEYKRTITLPFLSGNLNKDIFKQCLEEEINKLNDLTNDEFYSKLDDYAKYLHKTIVDKTQKRMDEEKLIAKYNIQIDEPYGYELYGDKNYVMTFPYPGDKDIDKLIYAECLLEEIQRFGFITRNELNKKLINFTQINGERIETRAKNRMISNQMNSNKALHRVSLGDIINPERLIGQNIFDIDGKVLGEIKKYEIFDGSGFTGTRNCVIGFHIKEEYQSSFSNLINAEAYFRDGQVYLDIKPAVPEQSKKEYSIKRNVYGAFELFVNGEIKAQLAPCPPELNSVIYQKYLLEEIKKLGDISDTELANTLFLKFFKQIESVKNITVGLMSRRSFFVFIDYAFSDLKDLVGEKVYNMGVEIGEITGYRHSTNKDCEVKISMLDKFADHYYENFCNNTYKIFKSKGRLILQQVNEIDDKVEKYLLDGKPIVLEPKIDHINLTIEVKDLNHSSINQPKPNSNFNKALIRSSSDIIYKQMLSILSNSHKEYALLFKNKVMKGLLFSVFQSCFEQVLDMCGIENIVFDNIIEELKTQSISTMTLGGIEFGEKLIESFSAKINKFVRNPLQIQEILNVNTNKIW